MKDYLRESCGVIGAINESENVITNIWYALLALQHRGQESHGACILDQEFSFQKNLGLLTSLDNYFHLTGNMGIGHVRYSTFGKSPQDVQFIQPFYIDYQRRGIALGHNGNIVNYAATKKALTKEGIRLSTDSDFEIILRLLAYELMETKDLEKSVANCMNKLEGAYSVVAITGEEEVIAFRDPNGFRPLCYGEKGDVKIVASESVALNVNYINDVTDINPGELLIIRPNEKPERKQLLPCRRKAHCMFEYVYFSRPDSTINGKDVYSVRKNLGKNLARTYEAEADVIVPVPDTARTAAEAISRKTGIPVEEGLIKNRYIGRTFIMPEQSIRDISVEVKLNLIKSVLKDKKVILVDDSIVRGTTSGKIVNMVKERGGAKSVEAWITCPPIKSPCFYGIDMSRHQELIAANKTIPEIANKIGVDKLNYQTIDGLIDAIGFSRDELCIACLTGEYPTPLAQKIADEMKLKSYEGRIYEECVR